MSLYAEVRGLRGTVSAWSARSLEHGVFFLPGRAFSFSDKESQHARFGFAALDVPEIRESVQRIAKTFRGA